MKKYQQRKKCGLFRSRKPSKLLFTFLVIWFFLWIPNFLYCIVSCAATSSAITCCRHDIMVIIVWFAFATIFSVFLLCFFTKIIYNSCSLVFDVDPGSVLANPKLMLEVRQITSRILEIEFSLLVIFISNISFSNFKSISINAIVNYVLHIN